MSGCYSGDPSNLDSNWTEDSVPISEVSVFLGFNSMQELLFLAKKVSLIREVSSFQREGSTNNYYLLEWKHCFWYCCLS